jgi:hypothetical protein
MRAAAARRFAAAAMASSSTGGSCVGVGVAGSDTGPLLPHTSIAHSSAAGPGRPLRIARKASVTRAGASAGDWMRAVCSTIREMMPAWSRISCR